MLYTILSPRVRRARCRWLFTVPSGRSSIRPHLRDAALLQVEERDDFPLRLGQFTDRSGKVNLRGSYAIARHDEIWLENAHIAAYEHGNRYNHEPLRNRKLLLHRREIKLLMDRVATKGLTLVPLKLYLKGGRAKIELGLCRGKKLYDKREAIAERDAKRDIERIVRGR